MKNKVNAESITVDDAIEVLSEIRTRFGGDRKIFIVDPMEGEILPMSKENSFEFNEDGSIFICPDV